MRILPTLIVVIFFSSCALTLASQESADSKIGISIALPEAPKPVGNYLPFVRSGNLAFINQVALRDGKIVNPGKFGVDISEQQAKDSQLTGFFNTQERLYKTSRSDERRF